MKLNNTFKAMLLRAGFLLILTLVVAGCGIGKSVEEVPLAEGETILLNFWGPVTYSYRLKGTGGMVSYSVNGTETISLINEYSGPLEGPLDYSNRVLGYVRLVGPEENKFYLGYDTQVEEITGRKAFEDSQNVEYRSKALLKNTRKESETHIDPNHPITFQGKFLGATSQRRGRLCKSPSGETKMGYGVGPRSGCPPGYLDRELMDYRVNSNYHVEDLKRIWLKDNHNSMISAEPRVPITFIIQNVQAQPHIAGGIGTPVGTLEDPALSPEGPGGSEPALEPDSPLDGDSDSPRDVGSPGREISGDSGNVGDFKVAVEEREGSGVTAQASGPETPSSGCSLRTRGAVPQSERWLVWLLVGFPLLVPALSISRN